MPRRNPEEGEAEAAELEAEAAGWPPLLQQLTRMPYIMLVALAVVAVIAGAYILTLPPAKPPVPAAFRVAVLSEEEPVEGALVEVYDAQGNFVAKTVTGANGVAAFKEPLPEETLVFKISKTGYKPAQVTVEFPAEKTAKVSLEAIARPSPPPVALKPVPTGVQAGIYNQPANVNPGLYKDLLSSVGGKTTALYFADYGALEVFVLGEQGEAIAAEVAVYDRKALSSDEPLKSGKSTGGKITFNDVPVGTQVRVDVRAANYFPASQQATVSGKKTAVLKFKLRYKRPELTGDVPVTVVDDLGAAVANAKVLAFSREGMVLESKSTGKTGETKFSVNASEEYYVAAYKEGLLPNRTSWMTGGANIALVLARPNGENNATLNASVVDEDGKPVAQAAVNVVDSEGFYLVPAKKTGFKGRAVFENLPRGSTVKARATAEKQASSAVEVALDKATVNIALELRLYPGYLRLLAIDALSAKLLEKVNFTVYKDGKQIAFSAENNKSILVRGGVPLAVEAQAPGYFSVNATHVVVETDNAPENATEKIIYLANVEDVNTTLLKLQSITDLTVEEEVYPAPPGEALVFRRGHYYKIDFAFVARGLKREEGDVAGAFIRFGTGDEVKIVGYEPAGAVTKASEPSYAPGCGRVTAEPKFQERGYNWIEATYAGEDMLSITLSLNVYVNPTSRGNSSQLFYRSFMVKGGKFLRVPFDVTLQTNESVAAQEGRPAKVWCDAAVYTGPRVAVVLQDETCNDYACVGMKFSQAQDGRVHVEKGEGFEVRRTDDIFNGPLTVSYNALVFDSPTPENKLVFSYDSAAAEVVAFDFPSRDEAGMPVRREWRLGQDLPEEASLIGGQLSINLDEAVQRLDFIYRRGAFKGSITLKLKKAAARTFLRLKYENGEAHSTTHASFISVVDPQQFALLKEKWCNNLVCLSIDYQQAERKATVGFTGVWNGGDPTVLVQPIAVNYHVEDKVVRNSVVKVKGIHPVDLHDKLEITAATNLLATTPSPNTTVDKQNWVVERNATPERERGKIEGTIWAMPKADLPLANVSLEYYELKQGGSLELVGVFNSSFNVSSPEGVLVERAASPAFYTIKFIPKGTNVGGTVTTRDEIFAFDFRGNKVNAIEMKVDPLFPGDAVYLIFNFSLSPCPHGTPLVAAPKDLSSFELSSEWTSTPDFRYIDYRTGEVVSVDGVRAGWSASGPGVGAKVLKYDASKKTSVNFLREWNKVKPASDKIKFGVACLFVEREVSVSVSANNDEAYKPLWAEKVWTEKPAFDEGDAAIWFVANNRQLIEGVLTSQKPALNQLLYEAGATYEEGMPEETIAFKQSDESPAKMPSVPGHRMMAFRSDPKFDLKAAIGAAGASAEYGRLPADKFEAGDLSSARRKAAIILANTAFRRRFAQDMYFPATAFNTTPIEEPFKFFVGGHHFGTEFSDGSVDFEGWYGIAVSSDAKCSKYGEEGIYAVWANVALDAETRLYYDRWLEGRKAQLEAGGRNEQNDYFDVSCTKKTRTESYESNAAETAALCGKLSFRNGDCLENCGDGWYYDAPEGAEIRLCGENKAKVHGFSRSTGELAKAFFGGMLAGTISCIATTCAGAETVCSEVAGWCANPIAAVVEGLVRFGTEVSGCGEEFSKKFEDYLIALFDEVIKGATGPVGCYVGCIDLFTECGGRLGRVISKEALGEVEPFQVAQGLYWWQKGCEVWGLVNEALTLAKIYEVYKETKDLSTIVTEVEGCKSPKAWAGIAASCLIKGAVYSSVASQTVQRYADSAAVEAARDEAEVVTSSSEFQEARSNYENARTAVDAAKKDVDAAKKELAEKKLEKALTDEQRQALTAAENALKTAENDLAQKEKSLREAIEEIKRDAERSKESKQNKEKVDKVITALDVSTQLHDFACSPVLLNILQFIGAAKQVSSNDRVLFWFLKPGETWPEPDEPDDKALYDCHPSGSLDFLIEVEPKALRAEEGKVASCDGKEELQVKVKEATVKPPYQEATFKIKSWS